MGKRPAASASAATQAKKAVKVVDPTERKCKEVIKALAEFEPESLRAVFGDVLPLSLAICQEERHSYQQGVVDMVGSEMAKHEESLEGNIAEAQAKVEQLDKDKEEKEKQLEELEKALEGKKAEAHEKKYALADAALAFRGAKEGLKEAEAKQKQGEKELSEVALKYDGLAKTISEVLEPLREGTMDKEKVPQAANEIVPTLQRYFFVEESLVPAIPTVLSKEPSARGSFDTMAATNLEELAKRALQSFSATIKGGEAAKAERQAAVEEADEALTSARSAQRVSAGIFTTAQTAEEAAQAAVSNAKQEIRAFGPDKKARSSALARAEKALKTFREGPSESFKELSTRSNVVEEEPAPMETAEATEAGETAEAAEAPAEAAPDTAMPEAETVAA